MIERLSACAFLCLLLLQPGCLSRQEETLQLDKQDPESSGISTPGFEGDHSGKCDEHAQDLRKLMGDHQRPAPPSVPKVSFTFRSAPMAGVGRELSKLAGVGISVISDGKAQPPLGERRVTLRMNDAGLLDALDWITRQVDAQYSWDGHTVCIATDPDRLYNERLVEKVYPLRTMRRYDKPIIGHDDFEMEKNGIFSSVQLCLGEYLRRRPDAALTMMPSRTEFLAACSRPAHARIDEVLDEIARGKESTPLLADLDDAELRKALDRPVRCNYKDLPALQVIKKLSGQAEVNIAVDPRELPGGELTPLTLDTGDGNLKGALDELVRRCRLKGYALEPGRGIWLRGQREYPPDGRLLWQGGLIRSYYVEPMCRKIGLVRVIRHVTQNVTPGQWGGKLPVMAYAPSGRLIVFHYRSGHVKLQAYLALLQQLIDKGLVQDE